LRQAAQDQVAEAEQQVLASRFGPHERLAVQSP
jgi:hypothetical protein